MSLREWIEKMEMMESLQSPPKMNWNFRKMIACLQNQNKAVEERNFTKAARYGRNSFDRGKARYYTAWFEDGEKQGSLLEGGRRHGSYLLEREWSKAREFSRKAKPTGMHIT